MTLEFTDSIDKLDVFLTTKVSMQTFKMMIELSMLTGISKMTICGKE